MQQNKNGAGVDTSQFTEKDDLANLKSEADESNNDKLSELYADKLKPVPVDLSKLSDVVKNDVFKKYIYDAKIKDIEDKIPNITNVATTAALNAKINEVKDEIHSTTNLVTDASLNVKINEVKGKKPSITNLATTAALENKIPNVKYLVKKADYDVEIKHIKNKYFITSDYNKFMNNILDMSLV